MPCIHIVPGSAPQPDEVLQLNILAFSAIVLWEPPPTIGLNGKIIQYTVNFVLLSNEGMRARMPRQSSGNINTACIVGGASNIDRNITVPGNTTSLLLPALSELKEGLGHIYFFFR